MQKTIYISGKISGLPEAEYKAKFQRAEDLLKACGYNAVNPTKLNHTGATDWHHYMRTDIKALMDCHAVLALPCFMNSPGAFLELDIASQLGMPILYMSNITKGNHQAIINQSPELVQPCNPLPLKPSARFASLSIIKRLSSILTKAS